MIGLKPSSILISSLIIFIFEHAFGVNIVNITIDTDKPTGKIFPKDFLGVYQTPLCSLETLLGSIPLLKELEIKNIRYELGWGKPDALNWDVISGSLVRIRCEFSPMDSFFLALRNNQIQPLFAITYCPKPLQTREGWEGWKDPPCSLKAWSYVCRLFAEHLKKLGLHSMYEIWNEPDLGHNSWKEFFYGDPQTYLEVYESAAEGLLKGDFRAKIGGAGVAWNQAYNRAILEGAKKVDFISIHAYGNEALRRHLNWAKALLEQERRDIPIFLTEYSSFNQFGLEAPVSRYQSASAFFRDLKLMLEYYPLLRRVYWAQWVDDSLGLLTNDLRRKALYNAFYIYQRLLPTNSCSVFSEKGEGVDVLAGRDKKAIGIVIWNESLEEKKLMVRIRGRFTKSKLLVYRIDKDNGSFLDNPESEGLKCVEEKEVSGSESIIWRGKLPGAGTVFLQIK